MFNLRIISRKNRKSKEESTEFKGNPLVRLYNYIPRIGFLEGSFGKNFLEEYNQKVKEDYDENPNLKILSYEESVVKGSNPFAVILANHILKKRGLRVATQADLEKAIRLNALPLEGHEEDTGLILTSDEGDSYMRNILITKNLGEQVRAKKEEFRPNRPCMIPLTEFELEKEDNDYGLAFKLKNDSKIYYEGLFSYNGKSNIKEFDSIKINEESGIAREAQLVKGMGDRKVQVVANGLSRLILDTGLNLNTLFIDFGHSNYKGRIAVVNPKGTP